MRLYYKFNHVYGIAGNVYGILISLIGTYTIFKSWTGILFIMIGAFFTFTVSACVIDVKKYRVCFPYLIMGFLYIGDWVYVRTDMELRFTETKKPFKVTCSSNKLIDVSNAKYLIFLHDNKKRKRFLLFKSKSKNVAENELARLSDLLGIHFKYETETTPPKILKIK